MAAVGVVAFVLDVGAVRKLIWRIAVEGVLQREAGLQRGGDRESLEGGAGHASGGRPVDLRLEEVLATVEAAQGTGAHFHRGHRNVQVLAVAFGSLGSDALRRGLHRLRGEGGGDPQAAAIDLFLAEPALQ